MRSLLRRFRNRLVRWRLGLPSRSLAVSPEVDDDLLQAHLALYGFAARFAAGRRCLDLGCGTGYGSARLLELGAREVFALDEDGRSLAYARRRFDRPGLTFLERSAGDLGGLDGLGLVAAINVAVQLLDPVSILRSARERLAPEGKIVVSLPPIVDPAAMEVALQRPHHRSNLYLWDWVDLLRRKVGEPLQVFRQLPPPGRVPLFGHPGPPTVLADEYRFEEVLRNRLHDAGSLAAVLVIG